MKSNTRTQESNFDHIMAILLTTFSMFVVGYTFTRVFLAEFSSTNTPNQVQVIPHEATLWSDLGR